MTNRSKTRQITAVLKWVAAVLVFTLPSTLVVAQHTQHDHSDKTESPSSPDNDAVVNHAGHDHGDHDNQDGHANHEHTASTHNDADDHDAHDHEDHEGHDDQNSHANHEHSASTHNDADDPDAHDHEDHEGHDDQNSHANHDHSASTHNDADAPDRHGHKDHEGHDSHAGHTGHDDHGGHDEDVVRIDAATMDEFGIVVQEARPIAFGEAMTLTGEVVFNADRMAHVTPRVSGVAQRVDKRVGDRVQAGEVMAVLHSRELAAARGDYLAARARLELAEEMHRRDERMLTDRIGTHRQVLESQQVVREQQIALDLAQQTLLALGQAQPQIAALNKAKDAVLSAYELRAPLEGIVIARHLTRGEIVNDETQQSPFIVADLSSVWVNLTVYQQELASIHAGLPVRIQFSHGIPDALGVIAFVSPALDETTRTATARVVLDNPDGQWRPGLFVTAQIAVGQAAAVVATPPSAITILDGQTVVFVQTQRGFEPRAVRTGRMTRDHIEVTNGLEPGERYVARNVLAVKAELNRASLEHAGHVH